MKILKFNCMHFLFWASVLCQICYCLSPPLGFIVACLSYGGIWLLPNQSSVSKIIISILFSLPMSYTSVFGDSLSHLFSWYSFFVIFFIYTLMLYKKYYELYLNRILGILLLVFISALIAVNIWNLRGVVKLFQILLTVVPCTFFYIDRYYIKLNSADYYAEVLFWVVSGTGVIPILQDTFYHRFGIGIGNYSEFANRVTFDALFKGYSVLSVFLGLAVVIGTINLFRQFRLTYAAGILLSLLGIVCNTSRTGLMAAVITMGVITICEFHIHKMKKLTIVIMSCMPVVAALGIKLFLMKRNVAIFSNNGRFETYINAIITWKESIGSLFFGIGLAEEGYPFLSPHNFILQSLLDMGIIASAALFTVICMLYYKHRKCRYIYLIFYILLSSMAVTAFFSNTYITACVVILMLDLAGNTKKEISYARLDQHYCSGL